MSDVEIGRVYLSVASLQVAGHGYLQGAHRFPS
jgi:hypothetical protein